MCCIALPVCVGVVQFCSVPGGGVAGIPGAEEALTGMTDEELRQEYEYVLTLM